MRKYFRAWGHHDLGGIGLVLVLWIILVDKKAIERINNKPVIKKGIIFSIIIYYLVIIIEIIQDIIKQ